MRKAFLPAAGVLVVCLFASGWYTWHQWRQRLLAPVVRAAVPPVPDLVGWPREYAARVRGATAAASRLEQPLTALSELACLYHANGCYREAQQVERGLHALEPKNAQWSYYLADSCQNLGDMEGTRTFLEKTLQLAPYYAVTRLKLAELFLKQGLTDEAFRQYDWRLALVPNDPYARLGLARIALSAGNRAEAVRSLETIARTSPNFSPAHNLLAELYAQMGDQARATEQRLLGSAAGRFIEANDPLLYKVYAWSFDTYRLEVQGGNRLQTRQLEASLPFYQKAVRLAPQDGSVWDALGNVYQQLNRLDDARAAIEAGLAAAPKTPALYATLAQMLRQQNRIPDAIAVLQRGILQLPALPELRTALGAVFEEAGRHEEAAAAYREAARLNPDSAEAYRNLGQALLGAGRKADARQALDRGLTLARQANDSDAITRFQQLLAEMAK